MVGLKIRFFNLQIYHEILMQLKFETAIIAGVLVPQNSSKGKDSHSQRQKHEKVTLEATD